MAYSTAEAQQEMLDVIAGAVDDVALALAAVTEAFELVDDTTAEKIELELFKPLQTALGRLKRTHSGFADRIGVEGQSFESVGERGLPSRGIRGFLDTVVASASRADASLAELQDSMRPVDVGDAELRAGLSEVRRMLDEVPGRTRLLVSRLGR